MDIPRVGHGQIPSLQKLPMAEMPLEAYKGGLLSFTLLCKHDLIADQIRAHFRLKIISCHLRRRNERPVFTLKFRFHAAVKEEGDVGVFFGFRNAQLG